MIATSVSAAPHGPRHLKAAPPSTALMLKQVADRRGCGALLLATSETGRAVVRLAP
jgi:hypothetical protein